MNITPLDIVSALGVIVVIASIVIAMYVAIKTGKEQKDKREKDAKTEKSEPSNLTADTSELRAELDDLKKRVAALEKK